MGSADKQTYRKYSTLVGAFLLLLPNGVTWYWGNMVVYTDSYYRMYLGPDSGFGTPWLISFFILFWTLGLQISSHMTRLIGHRLTQLLGTVLFEAGVFLSFWSMQTSVMALVVTMGAMTGLSTGLINAEVLHIAVEWVTHSNIGLATAGLTTGFSGGSVVISQLVTLYINPTNAAPDLVMGPNKFFTPPKILNRVPWVFVLIGCISLVIHALALVLIRNKCPPKEEDVESVSTNTSTLSTSSSSPPPSYSASCSKEELKPLLDKTDESANSDTEDEKEGETTEFPENSKTKDKKENTISELTSPLKRKKNKTATQTGAKRRKNSWPVGKEFSPREMLKTVAFYTLWINIFGADLAYLVLSNYYKTFGQIWIKDDHFLTNVGLSVAVGIVLLKVFWGLLIDKCGAKPSLIFFGAMLTLAATFWFFTPQVGKWFYFVWTTMFGCLNSGLYTVSSVGTLLTFGREHFTTNYGMVMTSSIVLNLLAPPIVQYILHEFGWFRLFFTVGSLNVIGLMLTVVTFPKV